jgi:signal transduction histidine kinase
LTLMNLFPRVGEYDENTGGVNFSWHWPVGAAGLAVANAVEVVAHRHAFAPPRLPLLWAGLATLPWVADAILFAVFRRYVRYELFAPVVIAASIALLLNPTDSDFTPFFLVLLSGEMACRLAPAAGLAIMGASMATMLGVEIWGPFDESFIWFVGIALGWAGGFAIQSTLRLHDEKLAAQRTVAERAAAEERERFAREIHDVIAHTLSVTMLHLTGARLALERGAHEEAGGALRDAERMGRESLSDIRRIVGVLGSGRTGTAGPMPTAADLPALVAGFQSAGLDIALDVIGDPATLSPATGLGVYRIAQESLSNVAKHAPRSRTEVRLAVEDQQVHLLVRDHDGKRAATHSENGGVGLRGMRERAAALGGFVEAGPDGDGWVVKATLPRSEDRRRDRA